MRDAESSERTDLTVLIVDDERPARRKLRRMVDASPGIARVFEAPGADLALAVIREQDPDVVFLDVRMAGMNGFQLLEALDEPDDIAIVFVTAYDEHAVRAFDVRAVDYLLKPYDETRFRAALDRVRATVAARRALAAPREPRDVVGGVRNAGGGDNAKRLLVEASGGARILLPVDRVLRIQADRNDAVFHAGDASYRLRTTMADLEARLDPDRFLRINRSEIVNIEHVATIEPLDHGDQRVRMVDGAVLRMSRRYRDRMQRFE